MCLGRSVGKGGVEGGEERGREGGVEGEEERGREGGVERGEERVG